MQGWRNESRKKERFWRRHEDQRKHLLSIEGPFYLIVLGTTWLPAYGQFIYFRATRYVILCILFEYDRFTIINTKMRRT